MVKSASRLLYWRLPAPRRKPRRASPLLRSCSTGAETVATLKGSDQVKVRYSFASDVGTCYAVTATVEGKPVNAFLIGAAHPAIVAFEQEVRSHPPLVPPPPPPPPAEAKTIDAKPIDTKRPSLQTAGAGELRGLPGSGYQWRSR